MRHFFRLLPVLFLPGMACSPPDPADLILIHAHVQTVDSLMSRADWIAIKDGRIVNIGSGDDYKTFVSDQTQIEDLKGRFVYPGFIEGHAHLMGVGFNLINVDLAGAVDYEDVVNRVKERADKTPAGAWIVGRGWHQDKWSKVEERSVKGFPTHHLLSEAVPGHPVFLSHASGHAALVNQKAMEVLGITRESPQPAGGEIFKGLDGQPTGLLNETAGDLAEATVKLFLENQYPTALELAIKECHRYGITGFHDAGENSVAIRLYQQFLAEDKLHLRLYSMLSGSDTAQLSQFFENGPAFDSLDRLTIRSVKLYSDGALGSRGAWLLEEYTDAPGVFGHNLTTVENMESITRRAASAGFQVCTHAIGDRANREVLDMYERVLGERRDSRFRIEHAQHIHPDDISRFASLGVIPAMQAIHMSSDRPWAIDRLGKERIESGAYVWRSLMESGSIVINGTDAPVEPINPIASFYSSVTRKTLAGQPEGGYEPAQKMTREEALRSYTTWPAYGAFLEEKMGSIEPGKYADLVVLDKDLLSVDEKELLATKVIMTFFAGKRVYQRSNTD